MLSASHEELCLTLNLPYLQPSLCFECMWDECIVQIGARKPTESEAMITKLAMNDRPICSFLLLTNDAVFCLHVIC